MPLEQAEWYVIRREWKSDPLTFSAIHKLVENGVLTKNDLVWRKGWEDWVEVNDAIGNFTRSLKTEPPVQQHDVNQAGENPEHTTIKSKIVHELTSYAVITGYLWVVLFMLWVHEIIILERHGVAGSEHSNLIVHALILGKVVLIAEVLRLGMRLRFKRPIVSIAVRSFLFAIALICFNILEDVVLAWWHGKSALLALAEFDNFQQDIVIVTIMTISMLSYHAFKAIQELMPDVRILPLITGVDANGRNKS